MNGNEERKIINVNKNKSRKKYESKHSRSTLRLCRRVESASRFKISNSSHAAADCRKKKYVCKTTGVGKSNLLYIFCVSLRKYTSKFYLSEVLGRCVSIHKSDFTPLKASAKKHKCHINST